MASNRLPDADSGASGQASQAGPGFDSGPAGHAGNGSNGHAQERAARSDGAGEITLRLIEELIGATRRLTEIYGDRIQLALRRSIVRAALGVLAAVCVGVWLGAAALTTLRGLCAGIADLSGRAWVGDLAGGVLALLLAAGAIALGSRIATRRELRRLEAKYERIANKRTDARGNAPSAEHA